MVPQSYEARQKRHSEEKKRIGQAAAHLIQPGDCVMFDSGTTVLQVAKHLARIAADFKPLTVITASLPVFRELAQVGDIQLFVLGGIYQPDYQSLVGPHTLANLRGFHVDKLFLGTDGLSLQHGVTTADVLEAEVSRAMVQIAAEIIIVSDSSKINSVGFTTIIPVSKISKLVTDQGAPADFAAAIRDQSVDVLLV
jgi:DeoR/GlpR family transcriptional regulator of sugar metabolism